MRQYSHKMQRTPAPGRKWLEQGSQGSSDLDRASYYLEAKYSQKGVEGRATHNNSGRLYARVAFFLPPIVAVYAILAMATPLSVDFVGNFVQPIGMTSEAILQTGLYAPWYFCVKWFYGFLLNIGLAPIQHPSDVIGVWYFQSSPSAYLLLLALKLPIIIFTLASGIMIFLLDRRLGATTDRASKAMLLWLLNPLVLIITVMWGTWDVVALFFTLVSLMLLYRGKSVISAASLLVAFVAKVIPIVLLPIFLIYLRRTNVKGLLRFAITFAGLFAAGSVALLLSVVKTSRRVLERHSNSTFRTSRESLWKRPLSAQFHSGCALATSSPCRKILASTKRKRLRRSGSRVSSHVLRSCVLGSPLSGLSAGFPHNSLWY